MARDKIFISYSHCDKAWLERLQTMLAPLVRQGRVSVWDDTQIRPGTQWREEIERALASARVAVLLVSPDFLASDFIARHELPPLLDAARRDGLMILPVILRASMWEQTEIAQYQAALAPSKPIAELRGAKRDESLAQLAKTILTVAEGQDQASAEQAGPDAPAERASPRSEPGADTIGHEPVTRWDSRGTAPAVMQPAGAKRLVILYKRRAEPDGRVVKALESALVAAGHRVFVDRHMSMGVEWACEIESEIRATDAVVVLLSRASVTSEMLMYEVEIAAKAAQEHDGKPRLLPVRLGFKEPLPSELATHLERLQYVLWQGPDDDSALFDGVVKALAAPPARPTPLHPLERDTGAVPLDSKFYVVRRVDAELEAAIARRDSIVLIKGARQTGKTSLLARAIHQMRQRGVRVVLTDLQKLASDQFASLDVFFRAVAELMADQLDLAVFPDEVWRAGRSPNINLERYLRHEVLEPRPEPLLWALDEVDRLFSCSFGGDVFALFRTWHNECALDPDKPWLRMTLVIAYATEAHFFITDPNQSPFNVGTKLELADFTREQVADLNRRYGSPLREPTEFLRLYALLNGQPYLTRHALNILVSENLRLSDLEAVADRDDGPFADHLRRLLLMLGHEPALIEAVRQVLVGGPCPDYERFYRLRSAGILTGDGKDEARVRCGLYERYLRRQLA
jgi:hypothetical protein